MMLLREAYYSIIGKVPHEDVSLLPEKTLPHFLGIRYLGEILP